MSIVTTTTSRPLKLLAVVEAATVTGPVKNLLDFCVRARSFEASPRIETSLVTYQRGGDEGPNAFIAAARKAGLEVDVIHERRRFDFRVAGLLTDVIERRAPDIVQTHSVKSHFLMRLSGVWRNRPWLAFHHGYTATDLKMRAYNQLDPWSLRRADRLVTVSQAFARQLAGAGVKAERIAVVHNSIDPAYAANVSDNDVSALKSRLRIAPGERVVLAVGRLSREKGHTDLVNALKLLVGRAPEVPAKLVIVGDGPERQRIEQTAAAIGIGEKVIFAGQAGDVRPYFAIADVFALPSHSEGSPNVLLEAMAAGVPVVATKVGGVPEIVAHGESALLVNPRDPQAMADAVGLALGDEDYSNRLTAAARERVMKHHSPEVRFLALLEVYANLVGAAAPSRTHVA